MTYKRKTKDVYKLKWKGEVIDCFDTLLEAQKMRTEYALAYHTTPYSIMIRKGRERL